MAFSRKEYYQRTKERQIAKTKEWREANREASNVTNKKSNLRRKFRDPKGYLLSMAKYRAKAKGIEFSITRDDISIPEVCPVLGVALQFHDGGHFHDDTPTLDRIDSTRGYSADNIVVVSWRANHIKNNATVAELRAIVEFYQGY